MRAINSGVMKQANRRIVLGCIRRQPISRAELADYTHLTRASITQIVDELMADGLVVESSSVGKNRLGRRQMQLEIVKNARFIAGVSISRQGYDMGLVNLGGEVVWQRSGNIIGRDAEDVLDEIAAAFRCALLEMEITFDRVCGLGVTTPGPLDPVVGVIHNPPRLDAWHNVSVANLLQQRTGWNVQLANLSSAHVLDELYFGVGRGETENFALLRVDESVSSGVVLDGKLFMGPRKSSPEIGHITLNPDGPICTCGNKGCLERYVSFPAVLQDTPFASWNQVVNQLDSNPAAQEIFHNVARYLSIGILNLLNMFSVDRVVISGILLQGGERLCDLVNQLIRGKGLHTPGHDPVTPGGKMQHARIAAMPAFHYYFCAE